MHTCKSAPNTPIGMIELMNAQAFYHFIFIAQNIDILIDLLDFLWKCCIFLWKVLSVSYIRQYLLDWKIYCILCCLLSFMFWTPEEWDVWRSLQSSFCGLCCWLVNGHHQEVYHPHWAFPQAQLQKVFCLRDPVFWGRIFLILRKNFPNMDEDFPNIEEKFS